MLTALARISTNRAPWLMLAMSAIGLELAALYFQYGMKLDPCVLCIYERVAVVGIALAGLLGAVAPAAAWVRWVGMLLWGISAAWGVTLALKHVGIQFGEGLDLSCSFFAEFPAWAPLDLWLPALFQPTGMCDDIQWVFVGLSMPQWMLVIFSLYLLVLAALVLSQWFARRDQAPG